MGFFVYVAIMYNVTTYNAFWQQAEHKNILPFQVRKQRVVCFYVVQNKVIVLVKHLSLLLNCTDIRSLLRHNLDGIKIRLATKIRLIILQY